MSSMGVAAAVQTTAYDFESLTVDNTAAGIVLTKAKYAPTAGPAAVKAHITLENQQVRYLYDANTVNNVVTSTVGHIMNPGDVLDIEGAANIQNFRAIRTGGSSGTLDVSYEA